MQYEVVCDPLDQVEAYPDPDNSCETNTMSSVPGSYRSEPGQYSHKVPVPSVCTMSLISAVYPTRQPEESLFYGQPDV